MAIGKTKTITKFFKDNSASETTQTKVVELVVVDNQLVPDFRVFNPGVIISLQ